MANLTTQNVTTKSAALESLRKHSPRKMYECFVEACKKHPKYNALWDECFANAVAPLMGERPTANAVATWRSKLGFVSYRQATMQRVFPNNHCPTYVEFVQAEIIWDTVRRIRPGKNGDSVEGDGDHWAVDVLGAVLQLLSPQQRRKVYEDLPAEQVKKIVVTVFSTGR